MGLESIIASLAIKGTDTPDTPCNPVGVSAQSAPMLACTRDTPDTPKNGNGRQMAPSQHDQAALARLVRRVLSADGWLENDIKEAVRNALADYHDALICFTELADANGMPLGP